MADRLRDTLVICRPYHVDGGGPDPAADHDDGEFLAECVQPPSWVIWAKQDKRLAAKVEQDLGRSPLVTRGRHRGEHQVVAELRGGCVEIRDEFGVEGIAYVHHHAEMVTAPSGQQAGRPVGPVAKLLRGL